MTAPSLSYAGDHVHRQARVPGNTDHQPEWPGKFQDVHVLLLSGAVEEGLAKGGDRVVYARGCTVSRFFTLKRKMVYFFWSKVQIEVLGDCPDNCYGDSC